ncbi:MAG: lysophospholipid acyltransferase family protein [Bacteroidia bacterium]
MKKLLPRVLQSIYSFYTFILFFVSGVPVLLVYLLLAPLPARLRMRAIYVINRTWLGTWGLLSGILIRVRGHKKVQRKDTYVILANHLNLFDIIMTGSCIQHPFKPLIKQELLRVPLLGQLLALTSVPVKRSDAASRQASFERMLGELKRRMSILIFPEGTRNRTTEPLKSFYDGAFRLAIKAQVPVLPVVLLDIRKLQPVGTFLVRPGAVILQFLDPVDTQGLGEDDVEGLKERIFRLMYDYILHNDKYFRQGIPALPA